MQDLGLVILVDARKSPVAPALSQALTALQVSCGHSCPRHLNIAGCVGCEHRALLEGVSCPLAITANFCGRAPPSIRLCRRSGLMFCLSRSGNAPFPF